MMIHDEIFDGIVDDAIRTTIESMSNVIGGITLKVDTEFGPDWSDLKKSYQCRHADCPNPSEFFTTDNRAKYSHVCLVHWKCLYDDEKSMYACGK